MVYRTEYVQRVGHVILDGVVDPTTWISYKVFLNIPMVEAVAHHQQKLLCSSLADAEKSYSGLADGCAAAGSAGCKLIEITGDDACGDDVKNLINDALDVTTFLPGQVIRLTLVHSRWLLSSTAPGIKFPQIPPS